MDLFPVVLYSDVIFSLLQKLKTYFAEAMVEVPSELVQVMTNHSGDRHVVATAVMAEAKVIVTFNLKHFPAESLRPWEIKAQHPDIFLTELYDTSPDLLVKIIEQQSEDLKKPPVTLTELLAKLSQQVPQLVKRVRPHWED